MTDTKHSPTPYRLVGDKGGIGRVSDEFNDVIIRSVRNVTSDDEWRATAAFVVTACNAHDGLVEQRDHLVEIVEMILEAHNGKAPLIDMGVALLIAPAAIALAKKGTS